MNYLLYITAAKKLMSGEELLDLLTVARAKNKIYNLTGMLLYSQGTFIQVLEGNMETIEKIYKLIDLDLRHKNVIKLVAGEISERNFPEWNMAFAYVNAETL